MGQQPINYRTCPNDSPGDRETEPHVVVGLTKPPDDAIIKLGTTTGMRARPQI